MSTRNRLKKNGGPLIAVSRIFYNSRDRQKFIGSPGELVADICECTDAEGGMVAKLYLHTGCRTCGGIPVSADICVGSDHGGVGDGSDNGDGSNDPNQDASAAALCAALGNLDTDETPVGIMVGGSGDDESICDELDDIQIIDDTV